MPDPGTNANEGGWRPTADLAVLRQRADLLEALRQFFRERGYWEVETPLLSHESVVDAHLDPFEVSDDAGERLFLQTSPEPGMKRLVAAGAERIFQVTRAFRRGEQGRLHNPEFTIVEWYAVGETYHDQMDFVEELLQTLARPAGSAAECGDAGPTTASEDGASAPRPGARFGRLTYRDAFRRALGVRDVLACGVEELRGLAVRAGVPVPEGLPGGESGRDAWLNLLLADRVEPTLGTDRPEFVCDYPASQAALARVRTEVPPVAERFELYWCGIELCNGYQELTDAAELRRRIQRQNELRRTEGKRTLPVPRWLLAAMESGLPECAGVALGFDRLAMLLLGRRSLAEVVPFPFQRA